MCARCLCACMTNWPVASIHAPGWAFWSATSTVSRTSAINWATLLGNACWARYLRNFAPTAAATITWLGRVGDEFALVMPGLTRESAQERMRELENLVRQVSSSLCGEALISLVFGDAYFPEDGRSAEELMDVADRRMHQQKQARGRELPSPDLQLVN